MNQLLIICGLLLSLVNLAVGAKFPSDVPQCKAGDTKCLQETITKVLRTNFVGHSGLNLVPFDPLRIKSLVLEKNPTSPVNIELKFNDIDLTGISTARVTKVVGFDSDPNSSQYEVYATIPKLSLSGPYSVDGKVLILPIVGKGKSNIQFDNVRVTVKLATKVITKKGRSYLHVERSRLNMEPEKISFEFENLFNGDKTLGDNMNKFLNENWKDIFSELKPAIVKSIDLIISHITNGPFGKIPYEDLFLQ